MRLLVCGSRHCDDAKWVGAYLDAEHRSALGLVIGCGYDPNDKRHQGVDQLAYEWAKARDIHGSCYPAHWNDLTSHDAEVVTPTYKFGQPYNRKAGPQRNQRMLDQFKPDRVIAFPAMPMGAGTAHMCRIAKAAGIEPVIIYPQAARGAPQCAFDGGYSGRCPRTADQGAMCLVHAQEVCDGCGMPATHVCVGWMGSFSCGAPLCPNCEAVDNHKGGIWPMKAHHAPKVCVEG